MRKLLLATVFFLTLATLYFLNTPKKESIYLSPNDQIFHEEKPQPTHEIFEVIKEINNRNAEINSVYLQAATIKMQQNKLSINVSGQLAMQKDKYFRLVIWHRLTGKEMDLGSNANYFWFWSKRMNPPFLHYAKHEDLNKTRLRTALNPNWLMESLNIQEISTENVEILKMKDYWAIVQPRLGILGEKVQSMTLIDSVQKVILGRYLYNSNEQMIACAEYQDFENHLPRKMQMIWHEENIVLNWDLTCLKVNTQINPSFWIMPNTKNKIDMGK